MISAIAFNHNPSLADRGESGGAVAGFHKPLYYTGKPTICSTVVLDRS